MKEGRLEVKDVIVLHLILRMWYDIEFLVYFFTGTFKRLFPFRDKFPVQYNNILSIMCYSEKNL